MTDPLARIEEGCYLAFRFMLRVSPTPTGCLEIREGYYGFHARARAYHPPRLGQQTTPWEGQGHP
jgi:hypothetical protein